MASGERSQTWFPEVIANLRQSWRAGSSWETTIQVRDELQARVEQILESRGIRPAIVRCSACGHVGPGASPRISVRALLLALRRFEIEPEHRVSELEKDWARYRRVRQLDAYGKQAQARAQTAHVHFGARA
jgi:hypothetical protein